MKLWLILFVCLGLALEIQSSIELTVDEEKIRESITNQFIEQIGPYREELLIWARSLITESGQTKADYLTCDICIPALNIARPLLNLVNDPNIHEIVIRAVVAFCQIADLAPDPSICNATIRNFADPLIFIATNKTNEELSNNDFCGIINPNCRIVNEALTNWTKTIQVHPNKPEVENRPLLPANVEGFKILQFTDIHLDLDYKVGTDAECNLPICCRTNDTSNNNGTERAGPFGHYNCALPEIALDAIYSHAKETYGDQVKYIFLTGDFIHSGIWLYNEIENTRHIARVTELLKQKFPNALIFPVSGNHEAAPCNMYSPPEIWDKFDLSWMYKSIANQFNDSFTEKQLELFYKYGYYTVKPTNESKLRIVVLNTNICYVNNFWLAYDPIDPNGQLKWFSQIMNEAELANEKVLMLAHISPGSGSCWSIWSDKYDEIVNRYENIIMGQFYGHSHTDSFTLAFERGTERPTSTLYIAPSMVTDGMNSGYKVYSIDGNRNNDSTWEIIDTESWILNTIQSNVQNVPIFEKLYSAKQDFGLESLRPTAWYDFIKRMISDKILFRKFERIHYKNTMSTKKYKPCEQETIETDCIVGRLCNLVRAYSGDNSHCNEITRLMDEYLKSGDNSNNSNNLIPYFSCIGFINLLLLLVFKLFI